MDLDKLDGYEFEKLVYNLLKKMGFSVEQTSLSADNGVDIIAYIKQPIISGNYIIQCKRWNHVVGEPVIRDLYGTLMNEHGTKGILITNSTFSSNAKRFADGKNIELIDGSKLQSLLKEYGISTEESKHNIHSFIDDPRFDKEQYLYLKRKIRENRQNREYYDALQKLYHNYAITRRKRNIDRNSLIDEYIDFNDDYIKRFCKRTKRKLARKEAVLYTNAFLYILKSDIAKAVEIYSDLGMIDFLLESSKRLFRDTMYYKDIKDFRIAVSALNLYVLFNFFEYSNGINFITELIISWNLTVPNEHIIEGMERLQKTQYLMVPRGYKLESSKNLNWFRVEGFASLPLRDMKELMSKKKLDWWWTVKGFKKLPLRNIIEGYYGYYGKDEIERVKKSFKEIDVILRMKKNRVNPQRNGKIADKIYEINKIRFQSKK